MEFTITVSDVDDHHHHAVIAGDDGAYAVTGRLDVAIPALIAAYRTGSTDHLVLSAVLPVDQPHADE
jgi:hypothetical protein